MSKHTPGPWVIIPGGGQWSTGRIATIEPPPKKMTKITYWTVAEVNQQRGEHKANASLIAAAPDLLKALIDFLEDTTGDPEPCRKAIDKALGRRQ